MCSCDQKVRSGSLTLEEINNTEGIYLCACDDWATFPSHQFTMGCSALLTAPAPSTGDVLSTTHPHSPWTPPWGAVLEPQPCLVSQQRPDDPRRAAGTLGREEPGGWHPRLSGLFVCLITFLHFISGAVATLVSTWLWC